MNARATRETVPATQPRTRRHAAGLVAQYVHELSERHARDRRRSPATGRQARPYLCR
jgi:hypothetical protein